MRKAKELLQTLPAKWNPMSKLPEDFEPEEIEEPELEDEKAFDWRITNKGILADAFHI